MNARATELIATLALQPHPEGGWYRETFRSPRLVQTNDGRGERSAITTIDFLLTRGQFSAWHRVMSDEVWHLLEGDGLRLWLMPPALDRIDPLDLHAVGGAGLPRHTVPAGWWQAAEPLADHALVGATVAPGFEFADFSFLRASPMAVGALQAARPDLLRLL